MTHTRLPPAERKKRILVAAVKVAAKHGFSRFTREHVAAEAEVSAALITLYFTTMTKLKRAVMGAAIKDGVLPIVAEGIVLRDPRALKVDPDLRARALESL